ncbi:MAG: hypothetical protein HW394_427 [Acidobacteria bacterium]|nr:hypothetical protein [Acidobacteriota bacterium]
MNEQEVRSLVREAIARHGGVSAGESAQPPAGASLHLHASHGMFTLPAGADTDGPCLIEPAVMCNHCGYCKSWGH